MSPRRYLALLCGLALLSACAAPPTAARPTNGPTPARPVALATVAPTATVSLPPASPTPVSRSALVQPAAPTVPPTPTLETVLDERFANNALQWPTDPQSTVWLAGGALHLFAREPGHFVAVAAPVHQSLANVVVTGMFQKVSGPPGGGYGLIVRDQQPQTRDGRNQGGRYDVLEASDRGQFGIWRREGEQWVTLVPWTNAAAIRTGDAPNLLTASAVGTRLTFSVNGVQVGSATDPVLADGGVGVFVGGDLNQATLDWLQVQTGGQSTPIATTSSPVPSLTLGPAGASTAPATTTPTAAAASSPSVAPTTAAATGGLATLGDSEAAFIQRLGAPEDRSSGSGANKVDLFAPCPNGGPAQFTVAFANGQAVSIAYQSCQKPVPSVATRMAEAQPYLPADATDPQAFTTRSNHPAVALRSKKLAAALASDWFHDCSSQPVPPGTVSLTVTDTGWTLVPGACPE
jgi:hypothetical protein